MVVAKPVALECVSNCSVPGSSNRGMEELLSKLRQEDLHLQLGQDDLPFKASSRRFGF